MKDELKRFRLEHDCACCLYYQSKCKARDKCVFDYIPLDSLDEDIELFLIVL